MTIPGTSGAAEPAPGGWVDGHHLILTGSHHVGKTQFLAQVLARGRYEGQSAHGLVGRDTNTLNHLRELRNLVLIDSCSHSDLSPENVLVRGYSEILWDNDVALPTVVITQPDDDHRPRFEATCAGPDCAVYYLDQRSPVERALGVTYEPWSSREVVGRSVHIPLTGRAGRLLRSLSEEIPADGRTGIATAECLSRLVAKILREIDKAVARLLSVKPFEPDEPESPGQLVTAKPHVTRGPTALRAATFLSAIRELALT